MLFNSAIFLFAFLPITFAGFALFRRFQFFELSIFWLVLCSLFFYGWWNPAYLLLIGASIAVNYTIGKALGRKPSKTILTAGITLNLALLGYFKYANFFVDNLNALIGSQILLSEIILPLAISFFTFQQIAYLVDAYRGETKEYSFSRYCLFVSFFPQLIAGPIVHHKEMMPQFEQKTRKLITAENFAIGITLLSVGLFKKVIIADNLALYASPVFEAAQNGQSLSFFESWGGALAYTFQLYFDFSGYSDMAVGLARIFGIILPLNFFSPYKAASIIDFWRRWHITLSRFLKDYLYIPLGGNRKGPARRYINLFITMLLGGLWHGAGWTFFFWGALHGLYLMVNHAWRKFTAPIKALQSRPATFAAWAVTFIAVIIAWVFFRSASFDSALLILEGMSGANGATLDHRLAGILSPLSSLITFQGVGIGSFHSLYGFAWIGFAAIIALLCPNIYSVIDTSFTHKKDQMTSITLRFHKWIAPAAPILFAAMLLLALSRLLAPSEFLYFDF